MADWRDLACVERSQWLDGWRWSCGIKSGRKMFSVQAAEDAQKDGMSWTMVICGVS